MGRKIWIGVLAFGVVACAQAAEVRFRGGEEGVELRVGDSVLLQSPPEGLWSIATAWENGWPAKWEHADPQKIEESGDWTLLEGTIGDWVVSDAYLPMGDYVKCIRRFTWNGKQPAARVTLSVRWQTPESGAAALLPGNLYYGNPSGVKTKRGVVPQFSGNPGEELLLEEHRYSMPFASLEWKGGGAALHSLPSYASFGNRADQWWSLGVIGHERATETLLLSGPCALNGKRSEVKAGQRVTWPYGETWITVPPGGIIEKTFYLQAYPVNERGSGFRAALKASLDIFKPAVDETLPTVKEILDAKVRDAMSRWKEGEGYAGFRTHPVRPEIVLGWADQAAAPGYALPVLAKSMDIPRAIERAQKSLDFISSVPFNGEGFPVRYNYEEKRWYRPNFLSQGQAMENVARAISAGRTHPGLNPRLWEAFLKKACDHHAGRILKRDWRPVSTNEGFLIAPLSLAAKLFDDVTYRRAALKAADYYGVRHLSMEEPYWGGTLDASCEDKEGAWSAFQGFMAAYELTKDEKYLDWAEHACDVMLTYTLVWDIDMPPGRLRDHDFKTRGWTSVSVQNMHLDVYGVLATPLIYRLGELTGRERLKDLAILMYRSCGQLIDPRGSQGEQMQQTNYAQGQKITGIERLRGGYNERWNIFWITAHFLNAAARFQEMGVF